MNKNIYKMLTIYYGQVIIDIYVTIGDRVWRMPLWKFYTKELRSLPSVDITNKGHHYGDACIAAAFLNEFVCPGMCWLHMDVTGHKNFTYYNLNKVPYFIGLKQAPFFAMMVSCINLNLFIIKIEC